MIWIEAGRRKRVAKYHCCIFERDAVLSQVCRGLLGFHAKFMASL
jgi:hypothetical protein